MLRESIQLLREYSEMSIVNIFWSRPSNPINNFIPSIISATQRICHPEDLHPFMRLLKEKDLNLFLNILDKREDLISGDIVISQSVVQAYAREFYELSEKILLEEGAETAQVLYSKALKLCAFSLPEFEDLAVTLFINIFRVTNPKGKDLPSSIATFKALIDSWTTRMHIMHKVNDLQESIGFPKPIEKGDWYIFQLQIGGKHFCDLEVMNTGSYSCKLIIEGTVVIIYVSGGITAVLYALAHIEVAPMLPAIIPMYAGIGKYIVAPIVHNMVDEGKNMNKDNEDKKAEDKEDKEGTDSGDLQV